MTSQFVSLNKFFRVDPTNEVDPDWLQAVATKNMSAIVNLLYKRFEAFVEEVNFIDNDCEKARALLRDIDAPRQNEDAARRNLVRVENESRASLALQQLRMEEMKSAARNAYRETIPEQNRKDRVLNQLWEEEAKTAGRNAKREYLGQQARFWAEYDAAPPDRRADLLDRENRRLQGGKKPRRSRRRSPRRRSRK